MRTTQIIKTILGPGVAVTLASIALAASIHGHAADRGAVLAAVLLIGMMLLSAGAIMASSRERRKVERDAAQKRCPCCGDPMRGIVDAQSGPLWRCVECMRDEAAVFSLPS